MTPYGSDFIEKVRAATDIVSIVEQYFPLKKDGVNFMALCPFHSEKTPSFIVSKQKQLYKCFGCGEGGNVFNFVMKMKKVPFPEAVKILANKAGIPIPDFKPTPLEKRRDYLFSVMKKVSEFYSGCLMKNQRALEYLKKRGISSETIKEFEIGYSLDGKGLISFAKKENIKIIDMEELGLISNSEGKDVDKFRKRIIFPIHDIRGRVVAFGGRTITDSGIKYLNSPETILFHRSEILFSMNRAKPAVVNEGQVIVTEGYTNVISMYQFGFKNVCGVLGTALTDQHLYQLRRFTDKVFLLFVPDSAGISAVLRVAPKILSAELQGFVVELETAKDVDEYLHYSGRDSLKETISKAMPVMDFIRKLFMQRYYMKPDWKAEFVKEIIPYLKAPANAVTREEEIKKTAELLNISEESLKELTKGKAEYYEERVCRLIRRKPGVFTVVYKPDRNNLTKDTFPFKQFLMKFIPESEDICRDDAPAHKWILNNTRVEIRIFDKELSVNILYRCARCLKIEAAEFRYFLEDLYIKIPKMKRLIEKIPDVFTVVYKPDRNNLTKDTLPLKQFLMKFSPKRQEQDMCEICMGGDDPIHKWILDNTVVGIGIFDGRMSVTILYPCAKCSAIEAASFGYFLEDLYIKIPIAKEE